LKEKRRARKNTNGYPSSRERYGYNDSEFPYDDENIIYIVIIKILESYYLEFSHNQ